MGWFEKQIKQRKELDQQVFEESFFNAAEAVLGQREASRMSDERIVTRQAIEDLLKYYHYKPVEIPKSVKDHDEQLDYSLRPHGIMRRNIHLDRGWYKNSYGPVLAYLKEDGSPVAILPKKTSGYCYTDHRTGRKMTMDAKTAELFEEEAFCFYKPLPQKAIGLGDLIQYIRSCISLSDRVLVASAALAATLVGMMVPRITKALTGPVLQSGMVSGLLSVAIYVATQPLNAFMGTLLLAVAVFCIVAIWFFLKGYKKGLANQLMRILRHIPGAKRWARNFIETHQEQLNTIDVQIAALHNQNPRTFLGAVLLELGCRFASSLEIMFCLLVLMPSVNYFQCVLILAFTSLFANMLFFMPLQLGGREGGFLMSVDGLGMTASAGIFVALIVRMRELIWTAIGLLLIKFEKKPSGNERPKC